MNGVGGQGLRRAGGAHGRAGIAYDAALMTPLTHAAVKYVAAAACAA